MIIVPLGSSFVHSGMDHELETGRAMEVKRARVDEQDGPVSGVDVAKRMPMSINLNGFLSRGWLSGYVVKKDITFCKMNRNYIVKIFNRG